MSTRGHDANTKAVQQWSCQNRGLIEPVGTAFCALAGYPNGVRNDNGATAELTKFLSRTPFLDLHFQAGGYGEHDEHAWRRRLSFESDYVVRAIAILLIFAIAAAVAYKTLAPIPAHLW